MRNSRLWARMLAVESGTVIEGISWEENPGPDGEPEITVIARVRPHRRRAGRCGICGRRCPGSGLLTLSTGDAVSRVW